VSFRGFQIGCRGYLARLARWIRIVPEIRGEEHAMQRRVFAMFVESLASGVAHRA
jgi:hypothetical protein